MAVFFICQAVLMISCFNFQLLYTIQPQYLITWNNNHLFACSMGLNGAGHLCSPWHQRGWLDWSWETCFQGGCRLVLAVKWELSRTCLLGAFNLCHTRLSIWLLQFPHGYWDSEAGSRGLLMPRLRVPECYFSAFNWTMQLQAQIRFERRKYKLSPDRRSCMCI